jgi:DNA-binding PadR family transcriptional regulator
MDVRTICLAILTRGDATGYEIKKLFEDGGYGHFAEASFGSIYPALNRLTEECLVSVRAEAQEKRPDRKVYSLTQAGRHAVAKGLMKPLAEDRHRSPFVFTMLFSHLLPQEHVLGLIDDYMRQSEEKLLRLEQAKTGAQTAGERFAIDYGRALYRTMLDFLREHRGEFERPPRPAEAAE